MLDLSEAIVLRCLDSRQLDKVHCPEAAALCSEARHFAPYWASSVQLRVSRLARGSPNRGNNDDRRQWRKQGVAVGAAASKTRAMRSGCWVPQPGCGAPLANRVTLRCPPEVYWHIKGRASLQRAEASQQGILSSCCESVQQGTIVSKTENFIHPAQT